jgi:acyl-CoA synthetase (AMP-forming)/AMP-acid ligase II
MGEQAHTLIEAFERVADRQETGYSYVAENGSIRFESFHELYRRASRIAGGLHAHGMRKGDRVGLILADSQQFIDSFFGALLLGAVPVPIYPPGHLGQPAAYLNNVASILAKARLRMLLTDARVRSLLGHLLATMPAGSLLTPDAPLDASGAECGYPRVTIRPEDTAFLQFTSGSTSRPRGVRLSHANLVANLQAMVGKRGLQSTPEDYGVSWLPLYHDMGLIGKVFVPMYAGMRGACFMSPALFLKRPSAWLRQISQQKGTITFAPNFAYRLCMTRVDAKLLEGVDLSSLRIAGCGAEPIRYEVLTAFARKFEPLGFRPEALMPCYGLAEHTLAATFSPASRGIIADRVLAEALAEGEAVPADEPAGASETTDTAASHPRVLHVVSCGRAFPGHELRIADPDGKPLPERRVGHILLRGPSVMQGYFDDDEETGAVLRDGWLHTGDVGYLAGGELYVCGRSRELIIIHGRNYYPYDLEWETSHTRGIRQGSVMAFGLEDPADGREQVVIVAETRLPKERHPQLRHAIQTRILEGLSLKVDQVLLLPPHTLPKTSSGKLQRARTRDLFRSGKLEGITQGMPPSPPPA